MTRWFHRLILLGCALVTLAPVHAQDNLSGGFSSRAEIEKRLATARQEHSQAAGIVRDALLELEAVCRYHLASLDFITTAEAELAKTRQALEDWHGFPDKPPYPIRFIDELRENRAVLDSYQTAVETQIRIINSQLETARDQLNSRQRAERSLEDKLSSDAPAEILKQTEDALSRERIGSRIAAEEIGRFGLRLEAQRIEQKLIQSKIELADLQLKAAGGPSSFTRAELDEILHGIREERKAAVHTAPGSVQPPTPVNPLIAWRAEFLDLQKEFWQARFEAHNTKDDTIRKSTLDSFKQWQTQVQDWADIAQLRLDGGTPATAVLDPAQVRDALQRARRHERLIGFAITDLGGNDKSLPLSFFEELKSRLLSIWQAELYLAEEDDIIDGKKVVTYRAVTVGKIIRLTVIIIVGWLLLRFVTRRLDPVIARRPKITPGAAHLISRFLLGLGAALLIIYGLNTVHIPFTAFAFLGGALAIGVGFGTQTLLKNFISGIILIFERPLKVGDAVEIEGVTGNIRNIGMRASVITHGNGIDTIIPNSNLLENQVTNWTLSDTLLRHSLTVGVDYSSPTREVSHALLSVAADHGLVLKDPAPEVRFEDFGDKALVFRLLFWFDTRKTSRDTLASDLRHMIGKTFAETGIIISSPQRDIQINPESSLRIELTKPILPSS